MRRTAGKEQSINPFAGMRDRLSAVLLGLVVAAVPLHATVLRYVPFEEQVDSSQVIVVATATSSRAAWNQSHNLIFTNVVFRVEETVKGSPGASVTLRLPGGVVDGMGQAVDGAPQFTVGSRYVLFLESAPGGVYRVSGFSQGSYAVAAEPGGKTRVSPQMASAAHTRLMGSPSAQPAISGLSLREFLSRVRVRLHEQDIRKAGQ